MMRTILCISILFLTACQKGKWVSENAYRPKNPKFSILQSPFTANDLIDTDHLYMLTKHVASTNGSPVKMTAYMGFSNDGRMFVNYVWDEVPDAIAKTSSFETATAIGYYTATRNDMQLEYFLPIGRGKYIKKEASIFRDTIILRPVIAGTKSLDTLVKTTYPILKKGNIN